MNSDALSATMPAMEGTCELGAGTDASGDWEFCYEILGAVSRTFSQPIHLLPLPLRQALTVGYLLCRVADTIEDARELNIETKQKLFAQFRRITAREPGAELTFPAAALATLPLGEKRLLLGLTRLLTIVDELPAATRTIVLRWVDEMSDGMASYCERQAAAGRFWSPRDLEDLERYCYFVAGTVGHMITDLFSEWYGQAGLDAERLSSSLRGPGESFGLGLQMVNIIKDITDDFPAGVCFIPESLCEIEGFSSQALLNPENRKGALRATQAVIDRARLHLDQGLEYVLRLPASPPGPRLFCLLPLFFAIETLKLAQAGDARITPAEPVKISRELVSTLIVDMGRICQDDEAILNRYHQTFRVISG